MNYIPMHIRARCIRLQQLINKVVIDNLQISLSIIWSVLWSRLWLSLHLHTRMCTWSDVLHQIMLWASCYYFCFHASTISIYHSFICGNMRKLGKHNVPGWMISLRESHSMKQCLAVSREAIWINQFGNSLCIAYTIYFLKRSHQAFGSHKPVPKIVNSQHWKLKSWFHTYKVNSLPVHTQQAKSI